MVCDSNLSQMFTKACPAVANFTSSLQLTALTAGAAAQALLTFPGCLAATTGLQGRMQPPQTS